MKRYQLTAFDLDHLELVPGDDPRPGRGEIVMAPTALSLNYRDLLVITGLYNPRLPLPCTPISDGAGKIVATGEGVTGLAEGDLVMTSFVSGWLEGPYRAEYQKTSLGTPGPGLAASRVVLPAHAVVPVPKGYDAAQASTLPIAALTAWSALVTEGKLRAGQTVLTLGTGGVSIFTLQIAKAMGATVIITSSSSEKLERARALGADHTINYRDEPRWERKVLEMTGGEGVDVVVENGGVQTLSRSLRSVRGGGTISLLGALTGLQGEVDIAPILMKRVKVAGILVDSRASLLALSRFLEDKRIQPVIDARFPFEKLRDALLHLRDGKHFGKIVIEME
jgi:NADPH:quinone reductase-like Zn-dependent oxidoreductase